MEKHPYQRIGVYVDVSNIAQNGGYGMQYDILRRFACRNHGVAVRLNVYVAYDEAQAKNNYEYRQKALSFHSVLRDFGYKVIVKTVKWFVDENGVRYGKANADLDMAVDALLQSERLDNVLLVTGDGDFVQVVRALQNKGCRVEALAFKNVAHSLRNETDMFTSGFLVPGLLPVMEKDSESRVERGICYSYHPEKKFGFLRFMKMIDGALWVTDSRKEESPYETAFVHATQFPSEIDWHSLPSRDYIFAFDLRWIMEKKGYQAENLRLVHSYR